MLIVRLPNLVGPVTAHKIGDSYIFFLYASLPHLGEARSLLPRFPVVLFTGCAQPTDPTFPRHLKLFLVALVAGVLRKLDLLPRLGLILAERVLEPEHKVLLARQTLALVMHNLC